MKKTGGSNKAGGSKGPKLKSSVPKGPSGQKQKDPRTPKKGHRIVTDSLAESSTPRREFEQVGEGEATVKLRKMIAERMKEETVYVTDKHFMEHYLPPIPKTVKLARVMKDLKDSKYLQKEQEYKQNLLGKFGTKPTEVKKKEKSATNEKIIFAPLTDVAAAIRQSVDASKNPFQLRMVPDTELKSSIRGCTFRVDACTTPTEQKKGTLHVTDIVVPFEFKVDNEEGDQQQNRRQVVSAIVHIMNDDIRRNFMYAVTIEDDRVSMWYFSRTHSVKATSFSFLTEPMKLVHLLVSLSCATEEQLGYDRRITLLSDMSFLYEFPPIPETTDAPRKEATNPVTTRASEGDERSGVGDEAIDSAPADVPPTTGAPAPKPVYYKTTDAISEFRAYRVAGRTTRIFKGIQVLSKEKPDPVPGAEVVVVKDIWIGVDSPTELQIQQQLFKDIQNLPTKCPDGLGTHELLKTFKAHEIDELLSLISGDRFKDLFLCADSESVGQGNKPVHPKAWDSDEIFLPEDPLPGESFPGSGDRITLSIPPTTAPPPEAFLGPGLDIPSSRRAFSPKKRCFYAFKQVCTRVTALPTLGDAIGVLRDAFLALTLMFCAGWVHRDISHGNVLALELSKDGGKYWQGKLTDLEYARRFPSTDAGRTDPKTGTPFFMACEIQSACSLYELNGGAGNKLDEPRDSDMVGVSTQDQSTPVSTAVKRHTYAHDLESLWWLLLWILTNFLNFRDSYLAAYYYFQQNDLTRRLLLIEGRIPIPTLRLNEFKEPLNKVRRLLLSGYRIRNPETDLEKLDTYRGALVAFVDLFTTTKKSQATWGSIPLKAPPSRSNRSVARAAAVPQAASSLPQASATTQSGSRKRKGMEESANPKPTVRRSSRRATVKAPEDPDANADGPGPSKKTRT